MKKLAIIGASYLQLPLINKAKEMGYETHVFAWETNDVGEKEADHFYPISIVEKDKILEKCKEIEIDGICSIASDLAIITVNYVAQNMNLISNAIECTNLTTNKFLMRERLKKINNRCIPKYKLIESENYKNIEIDFPMIVKPTDRSGSRGITKVNCIEELEKAMKIARNESFNGEVLVEEFICGDEYSVECLSWQGEHHLLQITKKYTTGNPNYIETGHLEPAPLSQIMKKEIERLIFKALDTLEVKYGASHSEIKIDDNNRIKIIEIGARMGGDLIGSDLVRLTTGVDFVKEVINVAIGKKPDYTIDSINRYAAVRFILSQKDIDIYKEIEKVDSEIVIDKYIDEENLRKKVTNSSNRHGYFLMKSENIDRITKYLPK